MNKVTLESEGNLRILMLNDPDKRNAIGEQMRSELLQAAVTVREDRGATALVVAGTGTAFCGGADLPAIFGDSSRSVATIRDDLHQIYECFLILKSLAIPTIAAVQGSAVGAGLNLAMACDLRVAGPKAKFAATFSQIGLHPGGGCTWFLVDAMGAQRALKLLLDGGTVHGPDAVEAGLAVSYVENPLAIALEMGRAYASMDPQLAKDIKNAVKIAKRDGFESALEFESWAQASSAKKPGIQAFLAKFRK